jgi:hypothetical protein
MDPSAIAPDVPVGEGYESVMGGSGENSGGGSGPIIVIDRSEIRTGQLAALRSAMQDLVAFARAREPRMVAYSVYFNDDASRMTVIQIHPDVASAENHMTVASSAFAGFAELVRMIVIDIYGEPSPALLDRLRRKAAMLGGGAVAVHALHAGFTRFDHPDPADPG